MRGIKLKKDQLTSKSRTSLKLRHQKRILSGLHKLKLDPFVSSTKLDETGSDTKILRFYVKDKVDAQMLVAVLSGKGESELSLQEAASLLVDCDFDLAFDIFKAKLRQENAIPIYAIEGMAELAALSKEKQKNALDELISAANRGVSAVINELKTNMQDNLEELNGRASVILQNLKQAKVAVSIIALGTVAAVTVGFALNPFIGIAVGCFTTVAGLCTHFFR